MHAAAFMQVEAMAAMVAAGCVMAAGLDHADLAAALALDLLRFSVRGHAFSLGRKLGFVG